MLVVVVVAHEDKSSTDECKAVDVPLRPYSEEGTWSILGRLVAEFGQKAGEHQGFLVRPRSPSTPPRVPGIPGTTGDPGYSRGPLNVTLLSTLSAIKCRC